MNISTRNLRTLPDVGLLKRRLQSMAMLDAILQPNRRYRYCSFDAHWGSGKMVGSLRNGAGDELYAFFNESGAFLKGYVHDSPLAMVGVPSERFYRGLPSAFDECRREPAFFPEDVTFCIWRIIGQPAWSCGEVDIPSSDNADGSAYLLLRLDGEPETYGNWATDYYERPMPIEPIEAIYRHQPLTDKLLGALNPTQTLQRLKRDALKIGYPA